MIDFEITVNVGYMTKDQRVEVQQLFHDLGLEWEQTHSRDKHAEAAFYSNKDWESNITKHIRWWSKGTGLTATHTVEELCELIDDLARVEKGKKGGPFNLEKALAGDPIETVGGLEVYELHLLETVEDGYPLVASVEGKFMRFTKDGEINKGSRKGQASINDLKMAPQTREIGGVEVPIPLRKEPEEGTEVYTIGLVWRDEPVMRIERYSPQHDGKLFRLGLLFQTREDANATANAIYNLIKI